MKCISLWAPWSSLIPAGAKSIETRSWATPFRGRLAIHAAKKWDRDLATLTADPRFSAPLRAAGITGTPPLGCVVAVCRLVACVQVPVIARAFDVEGQRVMVPPPEPERWYGDYRAGRFAWVLRDVVALPAPVPFRGAQGLFEVPDELLATGPGPAAAKAESLF